MGNRPFHFVVTADLALFLANRIGIQEGPTLCAHKLSTSPEPAGDANLELTNDDLRAHASARTIAEPAKPKPAGWVPAAVPPLHLLKVDGNKKE